MTPRHLRTVRERLKLTQADLAKLVGVATNTVARWERGELGMRGTTARLVTLLVQTADLTNPKISKRKPRAHKLPK